MFNPDEISAIRNPDGQWDVEIQGWADDAKNAATLVLKNVDVQINLDYDRTCMKIEVPGGAKYAYYPT